MTLAFILLAAYLLIGFILDRYWVNPHARYWTDFQGLWQVRVLVALAWPLVVFLLWKLNWDAERRVNVCQRRRG